MSEALVITNHDAANFLLYSKISGSLAPFLDAEYSLSEAAKLLGINLSTFHHHVKKMLNLKLIKLSGGKKVNGRSVKVYSAVAKAFIVPLNYTKQPDLSIAFEKMGQDIGTYLAQLQAASLMHTYSDWGYQIRIRPGFEMTRTLVAKEEETYKPILNLSQIPEGYWVNSHLNLDKARAKALQEDMQALFKKYIHPHIRNNIEGTPAPRTYFMTLGFAPIENEK